MPFTCGLGFVGGGNMAEGIVAAALAKGIYAPEQIMVADPVAERRQLFEENFGVKVTADNRALAQACPRIVLAIKPQVFAEVAAGFKDAVTSGHLLISIMAGVKSGAIAELFAGGSARVVRVMPNLAIKVGAGMAGLCAGPNATEADVEATCALFDAGGASVVVQDEGLMDAVTALSGSGPAYFYYFVEAMVAGGVACGLKPDDALTLAENTCLGAARMMIETGENPAELRRQVTSKGGTTQAALACMDDKGTGEAIQNAVKAAYNRGRELGG